MCLITLRSLENLTALVNLTKRRGLRIQKASDRSHYRHVVTPMTAIEKCLNNDDYHRNRL